MVYLTVRMDSCVARFIYLTQSAARNSDFLGSGATRIASLYMRVSLHARVMRLTIGPAGTVSAAGLASPCLQAEDIIEFTLLVTSTGMQATDKECRWSNCACRAGCVLQSIVLYDVLFQVP
eukprot:1343639-Pleurochrysis_carterae.AAC.2